MLSRRAFVAAGAALAVPARAELPVMAQLAALEAKAGGRLGVQAINTQGRVLGAYRFNQRFAFCSAFKLTLAALVLLGGEKGKWRVDERLAYGAADLLPNSPVTRAHLAEGGMTMLALAEAVQKFSDNAAANLLLRRIGLAVFNGFWRGLGDRVSRLDDMEPKLNHVPPGSVPNTTTPEAMVRNVVRLMAGGLLSAQGTRLLKGWMHDTQTGAKRLRAGLPAGWWVGDKTGTGLPSDIPGTYVDLAWVEPGAGSGVGPGGLNSPAPFAIAAFYQTAAPVPDGDPAAEALLAEVGRIIANAAK